jgi:kynurenine formamidase
VSRLAHVRFDDKAIVGPTAEAFQVEKVADGATAAGYYYAANDCRTSEHGGTHVDAPINSPRDGGTGSPLPPDCHPAALGR